MSRSVFVSDGSGGLEDPNAVVFGPDGNLYVGSIGTNSIIEYDGTTGEFLRVFVSDGSGGLDRPVGHVFGPDGNLYVSSFDTNRILRYNGSTGAFIDEFVMDAAGGLDGPTSLIFREKPISNVPTLSEWGLIAMAGLLGVSGVFFALRRRRVQAA